MDDPAVYRSFSSFIARHARERPDKPYLIAADEDRAISYRDLFASTNRMSRFLGDSGIGANDRVMLLAGNGLDQAVAFLGALRHGACAATVNVEMNAAHLPDIVRAVAPKLLLHDPDIEVAGFDGVRFSLPAFFGAIASLDGSDAGEPACGPDDPGVIFYTSGTDAAPKGVVYSHATLYHNSDAGARLMDVGETDRVLEFRSCAWVSAQEIGLTGPLTRGATSVLAGRFSRTRYLEWIRDHEVTIAACVPAAIAMMVAEPVPLHARDLPSLRYITSSSAPLMSGDAKTFEARYGIIIAQSFGASELGWVAGSNGADRREGTVGRPAKLQTVEIVDEDGAVLAPGAEGEIRVASAAQSMLGYLRADGGVERAAPGPRLSGDLGRMDEDGYLTITGRARDIIIRGGVNIAPLEIDTVLTAHPDVAEAATIGVPDRIFGEEVVSVVVTRPGAELSEEALVEHCRAVLSDAKTPKRIVFTAALPRNARGKLDRNALRAAME